MISTSSRYAPELPIPAWDRRNGRQLNATFAVFRTITRYRRALPREESDAVHGPEQKS